MEVVQGRNGQDRVEECVIIILKMQMAHQIDIMSSRRSSEKFESGLGKGLMGTFSNSFSPHDSDI